MLPFSEARAKVIETIRAALPARATQTAEVVDLGDAHGRVLARPIAADRDYPPFNRATRDGFAVRSGDLVAPGAALEIVGEIRAGASFAKTIGAGQCAEIMTGAAVPDGADAVVMIERTHVAGERMRSERAATQGQNIAARACEAHAGDVLVPVGTRLGAAEMAVAAQVGFAKVDVAARPRVAILSTGDEVVGVADAVGPFSIRNSNGVSVAALASMAGATPIPLGNSPDNIDILHGRIEKGLKAADVLVISGGVSAGKYDLVETVLKAMGAEFFFDAVAIRPGRPTVFGRCRNVWIFGLPGNPASTMVTFELFVRPAIELFQGAEPPPLPLMAVRLIAPVRQKAELTHFLPARLEWSADGLPSVTELPWQSSGDIVALAHANGFLVVRPERLEMAAGEWAEFWPRRDAF
ncbi:MAG: gephyrin-like molybdotransferase Glp [Candidatus Acidiferrales bacterium]